MRKIILLIIFIWFVSNLKAQMLQDQKDFLVSFMAETQSYIKEQDPPDERMQYFRLQLPDYTTNQFVIDKVNRIVRKNPTKYSVRKPWEQNEDDNIITTIECVPKNYTVYVNYNNEMKWVAIILSRHD